MIYLITDTHLGHANMVKYCGRPGNFTKLIYNNWAKKVRADDTVIHLGDIAWMAADLQKMMKLPGRKILIRGNHDKRRTQEYMDMGFVLVADELTMDFDGMKVLFTHKPKFGHTADINIHGHLHSLHREDMSRLYWPLSLEHMGYRPVALNQDVLHQLHSWAGRKHIPSLSELVAFRQDYLGAPRLVDYIGNTLLQLDKAPELVTSAGETITIPLSELIRFSYGPEHVYMVLKEESFSKHIADKKLSLCKITGSNGHAAEAAVKACRYEVLENSAGVTGKMVIVWLQTEQW